MPPISIAGKCADRDYLLVDLLLFPDEMACCEHTVMQDHASSVALVKTTRCNGSTAPSKFLACVEGTATLQFDTTGAALWT